MCFEVLLSIFAVHIEPLYSGNLSKLNIFFGSKGVFGLVWFGYIGIMIFDDVHVLVYI